MSKLTPAQKATRATAAAQTVNNPAASRAAKAEAQIAIDKYLAERTN
jgi:hypothetical protein